MDRCDLVVIGAGMGGLATAIACAGRGLDVVVTEAAAVPGGKIATLSPAGRPVDAGPTVLTLLDVFDTLLEDVGLDPRAYFTATPAAELATHFWPDGTRLTLHADLDESAAAVRDFAGPAAEQGFRAFTRASAAIFDALDTDFMRAAKPSSPLSLLWRAGIRGLPGFFKLDPYRSLARMVAEHFADGRLRQLFARYSTYAGSSPFECPATLALIAEVERRGVWQIDGGMAALAEGLAGAAETLGVRFLYDTPVEEILMENGAARGVRLRGGRTIRARQTVFNGDHAALETGLLGPEPARRTRRMTRGTRSLSAFTVAFDSPLAFAPAGHHNVFFSADQAQEFDALAQGRMPRDPTVYLCLQDRGSGASAAPEAERGLMVCNAPPRGDTHPFTQLEREQCLKRAWRTLGRAGLHIPTDAPRSISTPSDFERRFPATGGALYGRASHGWMASFLRPGARTAIPGLYCAGGSVHPGAGVPMAALSGRTAARAVLQDRASTSRFRRGPTPGGISMPSAPTGSTA